ncbi:MAG: hypothetical protein ACFE9M_02665 [Promethearchaeota archaeon]
MNHQNNSQDSEKEKVTEEPFQKGWQDFIDGIKNGFENFKTSLEEQSKKNKELWEENKEKVNNFFKGVKQDWDNKVKEWNTEIEQRRLETKEQWDAHKKKISQDFKNWQEKTKENWEYGLKTFRKGFIRAYLWILVLIIPILVIVIVVFAIMKWLLG